MKTVLLGTKPFAMDVGLLLLRLFVGLTMMWSHGWGKLDRVLDGELGFVDVLGLGEVPALMLTIFAEFVCAAFVALGWFTRLALVPLIITMIVAVFVIHADDPFSKQEFGLLYLIPYVSLFLTGPGKYSLDAMLKKR